MADGITNKGREWELRHSLWMGWTFAIGLFAWIGFVYIAARARRPLWLLLAAPSLFLMAWALMFMDEPDGTTTYNIGTILLFVIWPLSIAMGFMIRPAYLRAISTHYVVGAGPLRREREIKAEQARLEQARDAGGLPGAER